MSSLERPATNSDVYLRVWFDDGVNGSRLLEPDVRIVSVGYAMVAAKVADGGITDAAFKPNITLGGANTSGTLTLKAGGDQTRAVIRERLESHSNVPNARGHVVLGLIVGLTAAALDAEAR